MLLKVENFIFYVDSIVLNMRVVDACHQNPIILERLFLYTTNVCTNCHIGAIDILFGNKKVNVFSTTIGPIGYKRLIFLEVDEDVDEAIHEIIFFIFAI